MTLTAQNSTILPLESRTPAESRSPVSRYKNALENETSSMDLGVHQTIGLNHRRIPQVLSARPCTKATVRDL